VSAATVGRRFPVHYGQRGKARAKTTQN